MAIHVENDVIESDVLRKQLPTISLLTNYFFQKSEIFFPENGKASKKLKNLCILGYETAQFCRECSGALIVAKF